MVGDSSQPLLWIIFIIALILADAVQNAFRTAVTNLSEGDLDEGEGKELPIRADILSRIRKIRANPSQLTRSVWFWQILTAAFGCAAVSGVCPWNLFLSALALTCIIYVFGVYVPYLLGRIFDLKIAAMLCRSSEILTALSLPFTAVLSMIASLPARAMGTDPRLLEDEVTEDEILLMVNEGHEQGSIDEDEAEMITNIFRLDDKQAQDIMTHRGDIIAIDSQTVLDDAIKFMSDAPNSRFPVFEGGIDNIIGALYLKDAMACHMKEQFNQTGIGSIPHLLREVKFIPETVDVDDLFRQMQESRKQMAIVVDEYGETSGLVTMEDILEEIVGNILDEYDSEEKLIARIGEKHFRINGKALLEDVSKFLDVPFRQDDYMTLSGYLTELLGHIPVPEDRGRVIEDRHTAYRFRILGINRTMIGWTDAVYDASLKKKEEEEG